MTHAAIIRYALQSFILDTQADIESNRSWYERYDPETLHTKETQIINARKAQQWLNNQQAPPQHKPQ